MIGRDHLDSGSVASPNRETEAMARRLGRRLRLAAAERPVEHGSGGATWVQLHHGGGVGIGYSQHPGMVIVARWHAGRPAKRLSVFCATTPPPV